LFGDVSQDTDSLTDQRNCALEWRRACIIKGFVNLGCCLIGETNYLGKHCMEKRALCGRDTRKSGPLAKPIKKRATLGIFGKERKRE